MDSKQDILDQLRAEFQRWEALLSGLSEDQLTARQLPSGLSIKDVVGHLWSWQQRSNIRMQAALHDREPQFPGWPPDLDPDDEKDLEQVNAWIHATNQDKPWPQVYQEWHDGFVRLIETTEAIPENDLRQPGRYPWLDGYPLALVLEGSYRHHHEEHYESLSAWLKENRGMRPD